MSIEDVKNQIRGIEEDVENLKEKVQSLDTTRNIAIAIAVFFGLSGGLGFIMLRKLVDLDSQKRAIVDARNVAVGTAKKEIEDYAASELLVYTGDATEGCSRIKEIQICWGQQLSKLQPGVGDRKFDFTFKEPFIEKPVIAEGVDGYNPGQEVFPFGVYSSKVSEKGYSGGLWATRDGTPATAEARVSYLAVGKWR